MGWRRRRRRRRKRRRKRQIKRLEHEDDNINKMKIVDKGGRCIYMWKCSILPKIWSKWPFVAYFQGYAAHI